MNTQAATRYILLTLTLLATALLCTAPTAAQDFGDLGNFGPKKPPTASAPDADPVEVSHAWSADGVRPGGTINLAVVFDIDEHFHIQTRKPKRKDDIPLTVTLEGLPEGVIFGDLQWPEAHQIDVKFGEGLEFHIGKAVVFMKLLAPQALGPGDYSFEIVSEHQACDDTVCLRPTITRQPATLRVIAPGTDINTLHEDLFADYAAAGKADVTQTITLSLFGWDREIDPSNIFLLLLASAIGGFLLNLTPCVLPVIPIKIMGLTQSADNRARAAMLGAVMSLGVVGFWLGLGLAVALLSGFSAANQLFQYPAFTITVGVVIAVMGAGMCGAFATNLPQWVYRIQPKHDSMHGSFGFGIMTAVLSTPCTAPMMGATAAWSATQGVTITLITFAAIGMGMALPYLVLSIFPQLVEKMPRTGPASELIKQTMGLLLIAAALYFLGTGLASVLVDPPDPPSKMYWWVVAAAIAVAGFWLAYRTFRITPSFGKRLTFAGLGVLFVLIAVGLGVRFTERGPIEWVYYTPDRLAAAQQKNKVVVLEFTAEWCLNCLALEQTVLHRPRVVELLNADDVAPIKVDITGNNEVANAKLLDVGRRTIPYLVVYDRRGEPVFASDAYTVNQVVDAITTARGDGGATVEVDTPDNATPPTPSGASE